jgi:subtilisin family serine protease
MVNVDNASAGTNPENNANEARITLSALTTGAPWNITIADAAGGGRFDGWITSSDGAIIGGDSLLTVDEPGNANKVITVGSFNTKAQWASLAGQQDFSSTTQMGALSYFSSLGPTRDGRQNPDIAAPGEWICSTLSVDSPSALYLTNPDGVHTMNLGTSMAAPHVTGVIALMLSVDPQLTTDQIRAVLIDTATQDTFTGSVPNTSWGYGKLNAQDAVAEIINQVNPLIEDVPTIALMENPASTEAKFVYRLLHDTTQARLPVITVAGVSVLDMDLPISGRQYTWNLIDNVGRSLANGLYLYVITTDKGNSVVGRLVITR